MQNTGKSHFAFVYPKAIGDLVFALPTLHTFRRNLPEAHFTLVVKEKQEPLARNLKGPVVDEVFALGIDGNASAIRKKLRESRPDVILDLAANDKSGLLLAFMRGRMIRPHRSDIKGLRILYAPFAEKIQQAPSDAHRVEALMEFPRYFGLAAPVVSFQLHLPSEAVDIAERTIRKYSLNDGRVVVLNVGASRDNKRWPPENYRALADRLVEHGFRVVVTGAREFRYDGHYDRSVSRDHFEDSSVNGENLINLITEGELAADLHLQRDAWFLRYSGIPRVVVGNDTGPMQIAGSVGEDARVKTITLFGPTNWQRYAPYDPSRQYPSRPFGEFNHVLVPAGIACAPRGDTESCGRYRRGCSGKECMRAISVETVLEEVVDHAGGPEQ